MHLIRFYITDCVALFLRPATGLQQCVFKLSVPITPRRSLAPSSERRKHRPDDENQFVRAEKYRFAPVPAAKPKWQVFEPICAHYIGPETSALFMQMRSTVGALINTARGVGQSNQVRGPINYLARWLADNRGGALECCRLRKLRSARAQSGAPLFVANLNLDRKLDLHCYYYASVWRRPHRGRPKLICITERVFEGWNIDNN